MNRKEVLKIVTTIEEFYNHPWTRNFKPSVQPTQNLIGQVQDKETILLNVVNTWHQVLKDYDYESVAANLKSYILSNRYPPVIADLLQVEKRDRAIPTVNETIKLFEQWEDPNKEIAPDDVKAEALKKMREILQANRGVNQ